MFIVSRAVADKFSLGRKKPPLLFMVELGGRECTKLVVFPSLFVVDFQFALFFGWDVIVVVGTAVCYVQEFIERACICCSDQSLTFVADKTINISFFFLTKIQFHPMAGDISS